MAFLLMRPANQVFSIEFVFRASSLSQQAGIASKECHLKKCVRYYLIQFFSENENFSARR